MRGSAVDELKTKTTKKKVNKRFNEYQPTWLSSPKEVQSYQRSKGHKTRNPVDINDLEIATMKKIRKNSNLGEGLLFNIDSHIEWLEKRHINIASKSEVNTCSTNDLKLMSGAKQLKIKLLIQHMLTSILP